MKLAVIVGATRQNRQTIKQAIWIVNSAKAAGIEDVELVDLKDYQLPFFDEPLSPRYNQNRQVDPAVQPWLGVIAGADAYIFVTPEYNHSIPGVLKNAIDYITFEMVHKPAAVASHGTVGGARAALMLKDILSESRAAIIPNAVAISGMSDMIDEAGNLSEAAKANPYGPQSALDALLTELKWYSDALSTARAATQR